jgi:hypothetical protein
VEGRRKLVGDDICVLLEMMNEVCMQEIKILEEEQEKL